jgi:hypothetical protein
MVYRGDPNENHFGEYDLRKQLERDVSLVPDVMVGALYIINHKGKGFPLVNLKPVVLRKGRDASLVTLTMYEILRHEADGYRSFMPHIICVRPVNSWWTTIGDTVLETLRQHFMGVDDSVLRGLDVQRIPDIKEDANETILRLSIPYPITLFNRSSNANSLRTV